MLQDILFFAWLLVSIALLIYFKVLSPRGLANAPVRESKINLGLAGGIFFVYYCAQNVAGVVAVLMQTPVAATTSPAPLATSPASVIDESQSVAFNVHFSVAATILGLTLVVCVALLASRAVVGGLDGWGLSLRKLPRGIGWGLLGWAMVIPFLQLLNVLMISILKLFGRQIPIHKTLEALTQPMPFLSKFIIVATAGFVAPIVEETVFRGCIQTALVQRYWGILSPRPPIPQEDLPPAPQLAGEPGVLNYTHQLNVPYVPSIAQRWTAILITAALFAAIHMTWEHFLVLFVLAIAMGYVYERTGKLWASIALHATFNCVNLAGLLLSQNS